LSCFRSIADFGTDGGGIRGYSTLLLLKAVFEELEDIQGHPTLPCEVFDMIAGTSTGGQVSALKMISAY
jgi:patatin-like phospholipase/acyl hydrolase